MSAIVQHVGPEANFTIVANRAARDDSISHKARGILLMLLSHRDGWDTSERRLADASREGRAAIRTGLAELEDAGYLRRSQVRDDDGRMAGATWQVTSDPDDAPWSDNPTPGGAAPDDATTKKTKGSEHQREEHDTRTSDKSTPQSGADTTTTTTEPDDPPPPENDDGIAEYYDISVEAVQLTHALAMGIAGNGHPLPSHGSLAAESWYVACDRLLRIGPPGNGGYVPGFDEALHVARWATDDHDDNGTWRGWAAVIQSAPTFRKKFSTLRLKARQSTNRGNADDLLAAAAEAEAAAR